MDLQEFKSKKPEFVKEASKCKDEFEFTRLAEKHEIKFGTGCFEKAYALFCKPNAAELSEDSLENVSGGTDFQIAEVGLGGPSDTFIITL